MKKSFFFLALLCVTLTGCLDTFEEFTIAPDGSGTYTTTMDMSGMMEMMEMMAAMDTSAGSQFKKISDKAIDSSVQMAGIVDTSSSLSEEQKRLFRHAEMKIQINPAEKKFKMGMNFPFGSFDDISKIIAYNGSGKGVGLFDRTREKESSNSIVAMGADSGIPGANDIFKISFANGLIERKVDEAKTATFKNNEKLKEMPEMDGMFDAVTFKTVFHLPRAATKVTGSKAVLSDDKKTVTVKSTMADLMNTPEALEFRIEY